jgi:DNA-damage-inducible protein J
MAAKTEMIHARVDPKLKKSTEAIFSRIGLSTTEAIRLFLTQVALHKGLPFPVATPNQETIDAMRDANKGKGLNEYRSFRELRDRG